MPRRLIRFALPSLLLLACTSDDAPEDVTPEGLTFEGQALGDQIESSGVVPTARGGTQLITLTDVATGTFLDLPFTPTTDGTAFSIADQGPAAQLTVRADQIGSDVLHIASARSGEPFDDGALEAGELARIGFRTAAHGEVLSNERIAGMEPGLAVWQGVQVSLVVALFDADDQRLVDDSIGIDVESGGNRTAWDTFLLARDSFVSISGVGLGSGTYFISEADTIEEVQMIDRPNVKDLTTRLGTVERYCFRATQINYQVLGSPWQFSMSGPAELQGTEVPNCVGFRSTGLGPLMLTVQAGARIEAVDVEVIR